MNWIKRIFCSQEDFNVHTNGLPKISVEIPMPKVKKPKTDISEPVYAMVQSMFDRPHTWKVEYSNSMCGLHFYNVKDIRTGLYLRAVKQYTSYGTKYSISYSTWMTSEEQDYLLTSLETVHKVFKESRIQRIRQMKQNIERNKVKELYK